MHYRKQNEVFNFYLITFPSLFAQGIAARVLEKAHRYVVDFLIKKHDESKRLLCILSRAAPNHEGAILIQAKIIQK